MSRHLLDPELAVGPDTNIPAQTLDAETLLRHVAAIPKPTSEALQNLRRTAIKRALHGEAK